MQTDLQYSHTKKFIETIEIEFIVFVTTRSIFEEDRKNVCVLLSIIIFDTIERAPTLGSNFSFVKQKLLAS